MKINVIDHIAEVKMGKDRKVRTALGECGSIAQGYATVHLGQTPRRIDTGRLVGSISYQVHDEQVEIGTNVEYAIYVEFGTRKMKANNFLRSAVGDHLPEYKEILKEFLKG
jgi:HK97 gp10 family phage protein